MLVVLAVVAAVVLAVLFRGRPSTFGRPAVQRFGLLGIVVIGLSTSALAKSTGVYAGWLLVAALALVWFAAVNRGRPGLGLAIGGLALNAVVIILNAAMPVSLAAVERAGVPLSRVPLDTDPLREELTTETVLPWLGEAVPLALPIRPAVVSPGDVLVAAGGALFLFTGLTGFGRTLPERILTKAERSAVRTARKARREAEPDAPPVETMPLPPLSAGSTDAPWPEDDQPDDEEPIPEQPAAKHPARGTAPVEEPAAAVPDAPVVRAGIEPKDDGAAPPPVSDPAVVAALAAAAEASRLRKLERQARKRERKKALLAAAAADPTGSPDQAVQPASADSADEADRADPARTGVTSKGPSADRGNP